MGDLGLVCSSADERLSTLEWRPLFMALACFMVASCPGQICRALRISTRRILR
jgi:hypothetical protein